MLDLNQISSLVDEVIRIEKKGVQIWGEKDKQHEYYPGYLMAVRAMQDIRVHAVRGVYPHKIVENRAPNMTDLERKYIESNYKQITLPVYVDYLNTIKRAFADNNWSIEYTNDTGEENSFRWYCEKGLPQTKVKMSLEAYIKSVVPSIKTIDAMGVVAVKPERMKTEMVGDEEVVSSEMLDPIPQYYDCAQIRSYVENEYYLILTNEHSEVMVGNRPERTGFVYELYDKSAIYRIVQIGAKKDNQFRIELYYQHDTGKIPVKRLEGVPDYVDGDINWLSPFSYAVPLLDDAIIDANMLRGVKATCMFPYRVMVGNICEHKMELGGEIKCCDGRGWFSDYEHNTEIKCPSCMGSGLKDRVSPYGVMLTRPDTPGEQSEMKASQPAMYYVSPQTDVPEFISQQVDKNITGAKKILHIRESNSEVKGSEEMITATTSAIDEKALYSFIKPISDQIFEMYEFILEWIGIIRYGDVQPFILTSPITFDFKTEYDYLAEISLAIKNGLPPFVVHTIIFKYLKTLFYNQLESAAAFNVVVRADRLLTMSHEEVSLKLSQGLIAPYEVILHDSAVSFVMELLAENSNYFNQDVEVQLDQLIEKARLKASETAAAKPTNPESIVNQILNGAV